MSRVCQILGTRPATGNTVSHANNRRRRRFLPNLHTQRFWLEEEKRWLTLRVSTKALRTIEKKGLQAVLADLRRARQEHLRPSCARKSSCYPRPEPAAST